MGHVELPTPEDGSVDGLLEPLPAFERVRPILERRRRLEEEASMRLLEAWREGRMPGPAHPPAGAGESYLTMRDLTPEEAAVYGADALEAGAAAQALTFALLDSTGAVLPEAEVLLWPYGWPGQGGPGRPEVTVFSPRWRPSVEESAGE